MLYKSKFVSELAVASSCRAIEADTILKDVTNSFLITICFALFFTLSSSVLQAQDVITLKNGEDIMAKVVEIGSTEIRYKRFDNLQGPTYAIEKVRVFRITYENGTRDVFADETPVQRQPTTQTPPSVQVQSVQRTQTHPQTTYNTGSHTNRQQIYLGPGMGLDYGGIIGAKFEYLPVKNFGFYAGLGYNLLSVGWNVGTTLKILPDKPVSPNLMLFYGYNGVIKVVGASPLDMTSYGITIGGNLDIKTGNNGNKLSIGLYAPIRSQEFMNHYNYLKSFGILQNELLPIAFSIGFNVFINK